jgi:hypothetical protein
MAAIYLIVRISDCGAAFFSQMRVEWTATASGNKLRTIACDAEKQKALLTLAERNKGSPWLSGLAAFDSQGESGRSPPFVCELGRGDESGGVTEAVGPGDEGANLGVEGFVAPVGGAVVQGAADEVPEAGKCHRELGDTGSLRPGDQLAQQGLAFLAFDLERLAELFFAQVRLVGACCPA